MFSFCTLFGLMKREWRKPWAKSRKGGSVSTVADKTWQGVSKTSSRIQQVFYADADEANDQQSDAYASTVMAMTSTSSHGRSPRSVFTPWIFSTTSSPSVTSPNTVY